jgi:hypothetical protein
MSAYPPPPVPQKLREFLSEYPDAIAEIEQSLVRYAGKPNMAMPFDGAIWAIEAVIEGLALDAREAARSAKSNGDLSEAQALEARETRLLHARMGIIGRLDGLREHIADVWGVVP